MESQANQHKHAITIRRSRLVAQNPLDTLPVLTGVGTGVAVDYAEYIRQFSDPH